ncbi:MAG: hypothetical protein KAR42_15665 [candidate division Zixibacteria bacterium]|nr:hypothetical protein [candidate division Zixibacteria bacterium]
MVEWILPIFAVAMLCWLYWNWSQDIKEQEAAGREEDIERWRRANELNGALNIHRADGWREYDPDYYGVMGMYGAKNRE